MDLRVSTPRSWSLRTACGVALLVSLPLGSEPKAITCLRSFSPPAQANSTPSSSAQDDKDARRLEPGKPIERELAGGESHSYQIALGAGQYLHAVVDQRGIDVVVALRGPDGMQLTEVDGLRGMLGAEELVWEVAGSGEYVLEVRARAKQANKGRYEVRLQKAAEAGGRERARIAAQQLYMEGRGAQAEGSGAGLERAVKKYGEAVEKWREAGVRKWEGITLNYLGLVYFNLSQYEKARDCYEQTLAIWREIKDRRGEGVALNNLGIVYSNLSQYEKARDYYEQALTIWREIKDRSGEGMTLANLGIVYSNLSQYEKARDYYEQTLTIWRELKDRLNEGLTLNNLGNVYNNLSQYEKARDYYEQTLAIWRELKDRRGEGATLNNLGIVYSDLNQYEKARDYYEQSLAIRRELKDRRGEGLTLNSLGILYNDLGQYEKARDFYEQTLAIRREIKDRRGEGTTLTNLGNVYSDLSQYEKARDFYEQALAIQREIKYRSGEGSTLTGLGNVYNNLSQYEKARDYYEQALAIHREIKDRRAEGQALYGMAHTARDRGNLNEARALVEAALPLIESIRTDIAGQELRSSYFASVQDYYGLYIDLLMRLHNERPAEGHAAAALQASERARARSLLDLLTEARAEIRQGVDPTLLERERSLQQQLNAKAERQTRLLSRNHTGQEAAEVNKEVQALTTQYQGLQAQIRLTSPRYAALTQPQPLTLAEMQQLLDAETLLLEYAPGEERSYLWAVTPTSVTSYELPRRAEIEAAARRLYDSFSTSNALADRKEAAAMSRMLLGPVAGQLGAKRLLIVASGALQYLPFGALPGPAAGEKLSGGGGQTTGDRPLIVDHEIVSLPSASTLAVLRRELSGRQPAAKAVAVLADPVFDRHDPRVKSGAGETPSEVREQASRAQVAAPRSADLPARDLERSAREVGLLSFDRLRSTRREADEIIALAGAGAGLKAVDFEASRATAMSERLGQYRIVHFATHGLLNSQHPELSGMVLSLVDERGQPQDGFLRAHEVYNLKLGADLVVLSGCQTALGKEAKGEGMLGLTRGFMYAGAPRVVASLWQVPDKPTADLMSQFYKGMLVEGLRPAAALRAAQVAMWKERRWAAPYYWAAFVLQGEWR